MKYPDQAWGRRNEVIVICHKLPIKWFDVSNSSHIEGITGPFQFEQLWWNNGERWYTSSVRDTIEEFGKTMLSHLISGRKVIISNADTHSFVETSHG